jgi:hypothetical protein
MNKYDVNRHSKYSRFACRGTHKEWQRQCDEINKRECSRKYIVVQTERDGKY